MSEPDSLRAQLLCQSHPVNDAAIEEGSEDELLVDDSSDESESEQSSEYTAEVSTDLPNQWLHDHS